MQSLFVTERRKGAAAAGILVLASFLFRLPPLLNARSTNSDAAVVGLQAIHILQGERSPFLWGSGYQTSADAFVAAAFFAPFGSSPLVLMMSSLTLHVIATMLVFATLRRRFPPWASLILTLPLVLAPASVHTYALYPPRQLSITLAIASFWAIHSASRLAKWRAAAWLGLGGLLYGLAISSDPYPMVLAPAVGLFALIVCVERPVLRLSLLALGGAIGALPFFLLHRLAGAKSGPLGLSTSVIAHNWDLLVKECLPWALSYKVYFARYVMDYKPWDPPLAVQAIQLSGAVVVAAIVLAAFVLVRRESIPKSTRVLGFVGASAFVITIAAFLCSVMVMDHFSMRYLAVLTLMLPFASATIAHHLGTKRFAILISPHLVASALCGWVGYGPFVRGPIPVSETPELADDYVLFDLLRSKNITYAEADYWASYRLTLLWNERIVVVPTNPNEDRYAPYRRAFEAAPTFAYIFDPGRSREDVADAEQKLNASNASVEKMRAGGHTVFVVTRTAKESSVPTGHPQ